MGWEGSPLDPVQGQFGAQAREDLFGQLGNVEVFGDEDQVVMVIGGPEGQARGGQFKVVGDFNGPLTEACPLDVEADDVVGFERVL